MSDARRAFQLFLSTLTLHDRDAEARPRQAVGVGGEGRAAGEHKANAAANEVSGTITSFTFHFPECIFYNSRT